MDPLLMDWLILVLVTPVIIVVVVLLYGFVGCGTILDIAPDDTPPAPLKGVTNLNAKVIGVDKEDPSSPLGTKGIGEPLLGCAGSALLCAISDALGGHVFNRTPVADRDTFFAKLVPDSGKAGLQMSLGTIGVRESRVSAPVLVVTGRDDQFVVPRIAHALARKYKAPLKEYDSFAHHIMSEPGWERPAADIIAWMDSIGRM